MRYLVLATDYDGTLAHDGRVDGPTLDALERCLESGRKLVLVTGRDLDELIAVCPRLELFEWVVAENGALLYQPSSREEKPLGERPPEAFIRALDARGVRPYSVGRVIVATWHPHETTVLELIRDFGLELQVIFNKGAVMILPSGINKASGLAAALKVMRISPHNVVGIGDAENDHALLGLCECGVAVANALPMLRERADLVTAGDHGTGVQDLVAMLIENDLQQVEPRLTRHHILLGACADGQEVRLPPSWTNVLVAGTSGGGKSTIASGFMERLAETAYQFCVIDPEGDYENFEGAITLGTGQQAPDVDEVLQLLENPTQSAAVNLISLPFGDRPGYFLKLLARLQELRSRLGHPHWIVVDEAHHVLPAEWEPGSLALPHELDRMMFITLEPDRLPKDILEKIDTVIAVGDDPGEAFRSFSAAIGVAPPDVGTVEQEHGEVLVWPRHANTSPFLMQAAPSRAVRKRHVRKYAQGELEPDRSFYFRGPEGKLNLRAQNLITFVQLSEGVDDETWTYHLQRADYAGWFRGCIKDDDLADEAEKVARRDDLSPAESRELIKALIEEQYTLPGSSSRAAIEKRS